MRSEASALCCAQTPWPKQSLGHAETLQSRPVQPGAQAHSLVVMSQRPWALQCVTQDSVGAGASGS